MTSDDDGVVSGGSKSSGLASAGSSAHPNIAIVTTSGSADDQPGAVDHSVGHDREADGEHDRPVRRCGEVDVFIGVGFFFSDEFFEGGASHVVVLAVFADVFVFSMEHLVERSERWECGRSCVAWAGSW